MVVIIIIVVVLECGHAVFGDYNKMFGHGSAPGIARMTRKANKDLYDQRRSKYIISLYTGSRIRLSHKR